MSDVLGAIQAVLDNAATREREIAADRRYVEQHKVELIQAAWNEAKETASYLARQWLTETHQAAEQAEAALNEAQAKFDSRLDYHRLTYAATEAQALGQAAKSLPEVQAVADRAIRTKDYATLRALHRVALPLVKARQAQQTTGELRNALGGFDALQGRIEEVLSELEPAELRTARQNAAQARQAAQRAATEVQRVNWRWSQRTGGPGPLKLEDAPFVVDYSGVGKQWI